MDENSGMDFFHPKQPGFVLVTAEYKKYSCMQYGISHFYQFQADSNTMVGIPDACVDILFCSNGSRLESRVAGTLLAKTDVVTASNCRHFGMRFLPGFNPVGKHVKMKELVGREETYDSMFDTVHQREELFEKLCLEESFETKVRIFLDFYLKHCDTVRHETYSLQSYLHREIINSGGSVKLKDLQEKTGYSLRYLNKVIIEQFGMAPKELFRIIRFQNAIDELTKGMNQKAMTRAAMETGYYDQSHFIKDFKAFTSYTPTKYLSSLEQNHYKEKLQVITHV